MALKAGQSFERTSKGLRFVDDVLTKQQMLLGTNDRYSDGYMVVDADTHDVYIYDEDATPTSETGRFIKLNTGPVGGDDSIYYITIPLSSLTETDTGYTGTIDSPTWTDVIAELNKNPSPYIVVRLISDPSEPYKYILDIPIASNGTNKNASGGALTLTTKPEYTVVSLLEDANDKIKVIIKLGDLSGGGSLPAGGTTGQAIVKKSNADGDVERRTVQGLSNIVDMSFTQRSEEGETWTDSVTIKKGNSNNSYLEIKQNTENGNLLDVYITDNTVDVPHTLVSKYYADYNAGKIATIKVNGTEQTVTNRTVDLEITGVNEEFVFIDIPPDILTLDEQSQTQTYAKYTGTLTTFTKAQLRGFVTGGKTMIARIEIPGSGTELYKHYDLKFISSIPVGNIIFSGIFDTKRFYVNAQLVISIGSDDVGNPNIFFELTSNKWGEGGSLPAGGTTGQALVKKSDADQDVEWANQTVIVGSDWGVAKQGTVTVSGTTESTVSISDLNLTSASDYQVAITPSANTSNPAYINKSVASFTVKIGENSGNKTLYYTIFAKGYGSVPNGGTTGQALIKKSNTDGDVEWKTVSGGGASLTIDTTQVGYGEATISEGGQNLSFTNQNGQGVHIGGISENGEMVTSKSYVDSKSPIIVNEGATFTNAAGNQQMQIRTGGTNSVIIKDTNASGTAEYWSYELPDKDYVDTEVAKRNAVVNFDNEYKTLQIRDVDNNLDFQVVKETSNDYIRVNEYAEDDRGQMQPIFDVNLPTKTYVDTLTGDLSTLTTTDQSNLVNAINEVYEKSGEPFRVKNWASSWSAGVSIDPCTTDKTNANLSKMTYSIDAVEGADYQIVGMISYEVFDNTSGGNRLNVWPVCQFTGNGQKELSVRWVCAGTTVKTAKRINAWVLLKHR